MNEQGARNTDVEIWRKNLNDPLDPDNYYAPSIHITENGDVGINIGGRILVAPIEQWFAAGEAVFRVEERPNKPLQPTKLAGDKPESWLLKMARKFYIRRFDKPFGG